MGVVRKPKKRSLYYGRRSYAGNFSALSTTVGVVLYRITIYPVASSEHLNCTRTRGKYMLHRAKPIAAVFTGISAVKNKPVKPDDFVFCGGLIWEQADGDVGRAGQHIGRKRKATASWIFAGW